MTELDRKLLLDRLPQPPYLQPHLWGLRVVPSGVAAALQMTRQSPLFFDQIVESTKFNFGLRLIATKNAFDEATKALNEVSKAIESGRNPDTKKGGKVKEKLMEGVKKGTSEAVKAVPKTGFWQWVKSWFT